MNSIPFKYRATLYFTVFSLYWFIPLFPNPNSNDVSEIFLMTYYFFPGVALPIIVLFLFGKHKENFALPYIALSCALYFAVVWMFSGERIWKGLPYAASVIGAFLFLLLTKIFVAKLIKYRTILLSSILATGGFVFLVLFSERLAFSLSCFLWTFFVGVAIDIDRKS
jgi:hypothetical protein